MSSMTIERIGLIAYLAKQSPAVGRTALMKYCYFLQAIRNVPLGYNFSLYSYGPFDANVLSDLGDAEALGLVTETVVSYPVGYGYQISSTASDAQLRQYGDQLLRKHSGDADWVIAEFRNLSAADLELESTLVYTDREAYRSDEKVSIAELARRVHDVKPHFSKEQIVRHAESLRAKGLLKATRNH